MVMFAETKAQQIAEDGLLKKRSRVRIGRSSRRVKVGL